MRTLSLALSIATLCAFADRALAQRGGRNRPEEIQNRVGAFFTDTKAPAAAGDKPGDLASTDFVRAAAGYGQPAVLYLVDGGDDKDVREQFERTLFGGDEMGIMLRCFHCGRIDLGTDPALRAKYEKQAPLFVVFDKDGKAGEPVVLSGYKASAKSLETQLVKASQGAVKPSLAAFAKEYGGVVRDLEAVLGRKKNANERLAKAGGDKAKKAELEKDLAAIEKEEQALVEREKRVLAKTTLPERPAEAKRLGGRGDWGGGGGGGGGRGGNGGGGNGG